MCVDSVNSYNCVIEEGVICSIQLHPSLAQSNYSVSFNNT